MPSTVPAPVRLIAIDMDGTLLSTFGKKVSSRTAHALRLAERAGIVVAIATGRRMMYSAPILSQLGLRADLPMITSNGTVTRTLQGDHLDHCYLEPAIARGLVALLRGSGAVVFTLDHEKPGNLLIEDLEPAHKRIEQWIESNRKSIKVVKPLEDALPDEAAIIQGMAAGSMAEMKHAAALIAESEWSERCDVIRTEYPERNLSILDLLPKGVSKQWALERLLTKLGIRREESMAIGDNWNDLSMLEWVGHPVLMGNAAEELQSMARKRGWKITATNDDDGVGLAVEEVLAQSWNLSPQSAGV